MQSLYGAIANYKFNYMEKKKSKGLGDTVAKTINKDCNCAKRQDTLNRLFPYNN